jgi:hypothetical protein
MRIISSLLSTSTLLFLFYSHALAAPPDISYFEDHFEGPIAVCDGIELIRIADFKITVKVFFDTDGTPITLKITERQKNEVFNSLTGESVSYPGNLTITVDLTDDTTTVAGTGIIVTLPGIGPFIRDTGRLVLDALGNVTFVAGNFDFGPMGDPNLFCDALG